MASYYEKQSRGMAFTVGKEHFARSYCFRDAETILTGWLQGQERDYAVRAVLRAVQGEFGAGASLPASLIETALCVDPDDEKRRAGLVVKALDMLAGQIEAEGNAILRAGQPL